MRIKTTREQRILYIKTVARWVMYYIIILASFVIMTSGTWLKPVLLVPAALCVSLSSGQYSSAVTGAVCGFLTDIACGRLFGYNAVLLTFFCVISSLLFELYLRRKFINYFLITAAVSFIQCGLDYKFYYQMWKYDHVSRIFSRYTLRIWIYTMISSVFVYILYKITDRFLMPKTHLTIEEAIKTN